MTRAAYVPPDSTLVKLGTVDVYQFPDGSLLGLATVERHTVSHYLRCEERAGTLVVSVGRCAPITN
jgi:hypothetical protein